MIRAGYARAVLSAVVAVTLGGCVTLPPNSPRSPQDPWESWNRGVYKVNDAVDRAVTKPIAKTYVRFVPQFMRTGVSNFFNNLETPRVLINDALQGKFLASANDLGRFLMNSTLGLGGLLDPATPAGLDRNDEDFGQTLGKWGVPPGPFVELPLYGPSDVRDAPAKLVDGYTNPLWFVHNNWIKYGVYAGSLLDTRAGLLSLDDTLTHVYDPYAFIRDAYIQRRVFQISDGKNTGQPLVDPDADLQDPGSDAPPAAPAPSPPPASAPATEASPPPANHP
jgi:phospholipid-binding lipoprotein MlaA